MPQGLFDKPKDKTPWIDPRFKQDQESTTPRLDQAISAIGGFMGLPQEGNIGSPDYNASQYGGLASAALPFLGATGGMMRNAGMRNVPQVAQKGIAPSIQMLEEAPAVRQVMPAADDVNSLIGDMNRNLAKVQANRMAQPRGINPSVMPPDFTPLGSEAVYNAGNQLPGGASQINYGARTNPSIGGRIDVVKMMNDLGNSRNAAKLQRGEMSTR